jgi:hypothetical protein
MSAASVTLPAAASTQPSSVTQPQSEEPTPEAEDEDGGLAPKQDEGAKLAFVDSTTRLPDEAYMHRIWQAALNTCRAADADRVGSVDLQVFLEALSHCDVRGDLTEDSKLALADRFSVGKMRVDYVACFRHYLSNWAQRSMSASQSLTTFKKYEHSQRRDDKSRHPWEFAYKRDLGSFNPYIPYIKTTSRLTKLDNSRARFPAIAVVKDTSEVDALLSKHDARVLATCKKCAKCLPLLELRYLEHEFRSCEGRAMRTGIITDASFQNVLGTYCKTLSAGEMGVLVRAFKDINVGDDKGKGVNYMTFLGACATMKDAQV